MTKIKTDIDSLFKQELAKGKAPVSDESMSAFKKRLVRKSFFSFSFTNFNIYYTIASIGIIGALLYGFNESSKQDIKPCVPTVKEGKIIRQVNQSSIQKTETKNSNSTCVTTKKQFEQVISNSNQEQANTSETKTSEDLKQNISTSETKQEPTVQKETPVTALNPQSSLDKLEIKTAIVQKQIAQKVDTLYANDTIKTVKRKVRVKWTK